MIKRIQNKFGLTVKELKELVESWPEVDEYGDPMEVWIGTKDENGREVSNLCFSAWPLDQRSNEYG